MELTVEHPSEGLPESLPEAGRPAWSPAWRTGDGRVRTAWRLAIWFALTYGALVATSAISYLVGLNVDMDDWPAAIYFILLCAFTVLATLIPLKYLDRAPGLGLERLGVTIGPGTFRDVVVGTATGGGIILGLWVIEGFFGWIGLGVQLDFDLFALVASATMFLFAAFFEEVIFRGYPLRVLSEAVGQWPAILMTSIAFGAAHNGNPEATLLSFTNTSIAGVLLALAWWRTGSLWLPTILHWVWNLMMGPILGLPVSGQNFPGRVFNSELTALGLQWSSWTGGEYGPEGGILLTILLVPLCGWLLTTHRTGAGRTVTTEGLRAESRCFERRRRHSEGLYPDAARSLLIREDYEDQLRHFDDEAPEDLAFTNRETQDETDSEDEETGEEHGVDDEPTELENGELENATEDPPEDQDTEDQDTEDEDAEDQDAEDQDAEDQDAEDQDAEDQDAEDQDAEDQDTEDQDAEDQDTEDQDAEDQDAEDQDAEDQDAEDQDAEDQDAEDQDAEDQDTEDQDTEDQDTEDQDTEDQDTEDQDTEDQDTGETGDASAAQDDDGERG